MELPSLYWCPSDGEQMPSAHEGLYDGSLGKRRPGYVVVEPTPENARTGALRGADWLLRTQIHTPENLSGDSGRYYGIQGLYDHARYLTQNWLCAHSVLAELAAYHATGNMDYLTSARLGGEYLLGLQVLDPRLDDALGTYREHHARFPLAGSRSGCSVIWAMVQLYRATQDPEYLDSARMYAKWFLTRAFPPGAIFPRGEYQIKTHRWLQDWSHACYGGIGVIFHQLYLATREAELLERGTIEVADKFIRYFLKPDGSRQQSISLATGEPTEHAKNSFHRYNDDFAGLSLLAAYQETKNQKYLDASLLMARWLAARTEPSGRLGGVHDASATALVHFLAIKKMTGTGEFDEPMRRFVKFLLRQQVVDLPSAEFHGGIRGQSHVRGADETGQYLDARVTSYAVCGLFGFADPSARMHLEVE